MESPGLFLEVSDCLSFWLGPDNVLAGIFALAGVFGGEMPVTGPRGVWGEEGGQRFQPKANGLMSNWKVYFH